jgi:hypothetical protein
MDPPAAGEPVNTLPQSGIAVLLALSLAGCGDHATSGAGEPFRVYRGDNGKPADYFVGALPGATRLDAGTAVEDDAGTAGLDGGSHPPSVENFSPPSRIFFPGQSQVPMKAWLSTNAAALALSFDSGAGYWVVPAGSPDVANDGQLEVRVKCDFSPDIRPGYHQLTTTAIGADGTFGSSTTSKFCISGRTADYINPCEPKSPTPAAVISLSWDTSVDLDLQVVTPEGRVVTPKHPTTIDPNKDGTLPAEAGFIDRDSNAACNIDGINIENLVFKTVRPEGTFGICVDLFDACKAPVVHFAVSVYLSVEDLNDDGSPTDPPTSHLEQVGSRQGVLLASQASGGQATVGTYLFEVNF